MFKKIIKDFLSIISNIWVQITAIMLTLGILIAFGYKFTTYYSALEEDPAAEYVKYEESKKDNYAATINVGMHINNFWNFDINANDFVVDVVLWFKFDPSNVSIDIINKFEIENAEIKKQTGPIVRMVGNDLFAYYYLRIQFKSLLNYRNFPLDDHRLFIIISNKTLSKEFLYTTDKESFSRQPTFHYLKDFEYNSYDARYGYQKLPLHFWDQRREVTYPTIIFSMDFKKNGFSDMLIVFGPLFLMFFFGLLSLALNITAESSIISLSLGSLSALVLYRFILQSVSPTAAEIMTSDKAYLIVLILTFLVFITNLGLLGYIKNSAERKKFANIIRSIFFMLTLIIIILSMYYMLPLEI